MKYTTHLILGIATTMLFACQNAHETIPANAPSAQPPAPANYTSPGKPRGPVAVTHRFIEQPALNTPLHIELSMRTALTGKTIRVNYRIEGSLASVDSNPEISIQSVVPDHNYTHVIQVVPMAEGQHQVILDVTLVTNEGQEQSSTFAIPVIIGDTKTIQKPAHPNKGYIQQDTQGQPIIVLPAQESGR